MNISTKLENYPHPSAPLLPSPPKKLFPYYHVCRLHQLSNTQHKLCYFLKQINTNLKNYKSWPWENSRQLDLLFTENMIETEIKILKQKQDIGNFFVQTTRTTNYKQPEPRKSFSSHIYICYSCWLIYLPHSVIFRPSFCFSICLCHLFHH